MSRGCDAALQGPRLATIVLLQQYYSSISGRNPLHFCRSMISRTIVHHNYL